MTTLFCCFPLLFLLAFQPALAAEVSALDESKLPPKVQEQIEELKENRRWENFPKGTLGTKIGVTIPSLELDIEEADNKAPMLKYKPNIRSRVLMGLSYGGLALSASSASPSAERDPALYGNSKSSDLILHFYGVKWSPEFFYQRHSGYYLENTEDVIPGNTSFSPRYQRPDISLTHYGLSTIYNFNEDRFSTSGAFDYGRRQTESGGAWLALMSVSRHQLKADDSFIPPNVQTEYGAFNLLRQADIYTASGGFGAAYNLVYKKMTLAALLGLGLSYQKQYFKTTFNSAEHDLVQSKSIFKAGLGYNGDNFMAGFNLNVDNSTAQIINGKLSYNTIETNLFIGYKFHDMHWNWIDNLIEKYWPLSSSEI